MDTSMSRPYSEDDDALPGNNGLDCPRIQLCQMQS